MLGSAVALNLLFHIPLLWAVIITGLDVLLLLGLQRFGMRTIEAIVLLLVATMGVCYFIEIFVLSQTQPSFAEMGVALISPNFRQIGMIYVAIGIIGATVMPHNLYLHSALVQSRKLQKDEASIRQAVKFNTIDSVIALTIAFFVNAAILVLAAIVFYGKDTCCRCRGPDSKIGGRERLDSRSIPYACTVAGDGCCEHIVCRRTSCERSKQHDYRYACRPSRDGRLHALEDQAMDTAPYHTHARHFPGGVHYRHSRR